MLGLFLILALIIWLLTSTFLDSGKWFSVAVVVCAAVAISIFGLAFLTFIIANIKFVLLGAITYFIVGGIWSLFKWYRFNIKIRNSYNRAIDNGENKENAAKYARQMNNTRSIPPKANDHKSDIIFWIVSWPFSIVSWVLGDLVVDICNYIYDLLGGIYTSITKNIFKDIV